MISLLRHVIFTVVLVFASAVAASAQDWIVTRTTTHVRFTVDKQNWNPVQQGMTIPNKAWIFTGSRGRAVLGRGEESITVHPGTLASVSTSGFFTRKTEVYQQTGKLVLDVEKRSRPHTYVQTPFLAAVVKGTKFEVTVTAKSATV
ncbi:MAG TPA: FecR domain-containing protein, partial [Pseudorhizobium sp.]|nr:FecR domain-containing protein [Pseudorhizobium sp.]